MSGLLNCINEHLSVMRDKDIHPITFRMEMTRLSRDLAQSTFLPAFRDVPTTVIVPILRAGLGMLDGVHGVLPQAEVGFLGIKRLEHSILEHRVYYEGLPDCKGKTAVILDPMLATGGSAIIAADRLRKAGAARIIILCAIAAPEGLNAVTVAHPDVEVVAGAVDEGLDDDAYIVPGLGDAGDRLYGEVV